MVEAVANHVQCWGQDRAMRLVKDNGQDLVEFESQYLIDNDVLVAESISR